MHRQEQRLRNALEGTGISVEDCDSRAGILVLNVDDKHIVIAAVGTELDIQVERTGS